MKKRNFLLKTLPFLATGVIGGACSADSLDEFVEDKFQHSQFVINGEDSNPNNDIAVSETRYANDAYRAEIVTARELLGKQFATTKEIQEETNADAVVNGTLFEHDGSSTGLFINNGEIVKAYNPEKGGDGILYIDKEGQINITPYENFRNTKDVVDAVQLTLLSDSDSLFYTPNPNYYTRPLHMVGVSDEGISDVLLRSTNFTQATPMMMEKFDCDVVAALDGGPSISVTYSDGEDWGFKTEVPNFLVFYKTQP